MRVLGIDPGSRKVGLGVVEGQVRKLQPIAYATVRFKRDTGVGRLQELHEAVGLWIQKYTPDAVCVEEVFVRNNVRSALILGQARGVALLSAGLSGHEPIGFAPARIKKAVAGHGRAAKPEMRRMVRMQLGLDHDPHEDAADALAVAMTHILEAKITQRIAQASELAW